MYAASLDEFVKLVEPRLIDVLADPESFTRVRTLTESLPASIAGFFGFERRLVYDGAGTDFALSLSPYGLDWLGASDRWPRLSTLINDWRTQVSADLPAVWLEFDTSRQAALERAPNVFIALERVGSEPLAPAGISSAVASVSSSAERGARRSRAIETCIEACPESADAIQFGFMLARSTASVRLCVLMLTSDESLGFLKAIAWPGSLKAVASAMETYEPLCDGFGVHVDVLDGVRPSIGLELLYGGRARDRQPDRERRWDLLFAQLVRAGLCSNRERDALLAWVSKTTFEAPLVERLIAATFPSNQRLLHGTLDTGLQHVKLSFEAGDAMFAKAYFGVSLESEAP